jgi:hypothetical protein
MLGAAFEAGLRRGRRSWVVARAATPQLVVDDTWGRSIARPSRRRRSRLPGRRDHRLLREDDHEGPDSRGPRGGPRVTASRASFNNELGVPLTMLSVDVDTQVLVAEAGARNAGDLQHMAALLRPDVAVVTAVGPVHLETFGDEDGVAAEKGRLVAGLGPRRDRGAQRGRSCGSRAMATPARRALRVSAGGRRCGCEHGTSSATGRPCGRSAETPWGRRASSRCRCPARTT